MLSGACGQLYGNGYTWPFRDGWQDHLDTTGSAQIAHVKAFFAPRPWYDLIPDQAHLVVTAGYGTFADTGSLGASDYATAARTPDGALVVVYLPTIRTITVDMTKLGSQANASWYDPASGASFPIAGSPFPNTGSRAFTPPGANADGDGDWVLALEATSVPPDTQPPTVPSGLAASGVTDSQATISWNASTDDVAVSAYLLYRDGALVRSTRSTSLVDTGLSPATAYSYRVAALDYANHLSGQSAPLVVTTLGPSPAFVQQAFATPQTPQGVVSATYAGAQTAGDTNILSVVDGAGNTYHAAIATYRGSGMSQAIWYASNIAASSAGANQVTVTFTQPAVFVDLRITEYARVRAANPFDGGVSANGSGTNAATGPVGVPAASELLFAAGMTGALFSGPGPGYTSRVITTPDGDIVEDAIASSAGNASASAPLDGGTWILQLAAFRAE